MPAATLTSHNMQGIGRIFPHRRNNRAGLSMISIEPREFSWIF